MIHPEKISYTSGNGSEKISYIFSKKSFCNISGNKNLGKIIYILANGTFLYFRKLLIFQEVTFRARKVKRTHSEKTSYVSRNVTF